MYIICNILDEFLKKDGVRLIFVRNMQFSYTARSVFSQLVDDQFYERL